MADSTKLCPKCGKENPAGAWICRCGWEFGSEAPDVLTGPGKAVPKPAPKPAQPVHKRRKSKKGRLLFSCVWFCLLGLNWIVLMALILYFKRPHPLVPGDMIVGGLGVAVGLFHFWVAWAVYMRRGYVWNPAIACASFSILAVPVGTVISLMLLGDLFAVREEFKR